jgi:mycofactocin precursor
MADDEQQRAATELHERTDDQPEADGREMSERLVKADGGEMSERLVEADLLIEDVSIDGMCGVY